MILTARNHIQSLLVLSEDAVAREKKRSLISLQMCFMGWLYELLATMITLIRPFLQYIGIPNVYFADAICLFVLVPFVYLWNDDEPKQIIFEEGWYQGTRYILGMYTRPDPPTTPQIPEQNPNDNGYKLSAMIHQKRINTRNTASQVGSLFQRRSSYPNCSVPKYSLGDNDVGRFRKCNSLKELSSKQI